MISGLSPEVFAIGRCALPEMQYLLHQSSMLAAGMKLWRSAGRALRKVVTRNSALSTAFLLAIFAPALAQVSPNRNLSDDFANAAARAISAIQNDSGTDRSNPTPRALRAVQDADSRADNSAERLLATFLNTALAQRALDNDRRRISPGLTGLGRNQDVCLGSLLNELRLREFHSLPVSCQMWTDPAGSGSQEIPREEQQAASSNSSSRGQETTPIFGNDSDQAADRPREAERPRVPSNQKARSLTDALTEVTGWRKLLQSLVGNTNGLDAWLKAYWWILALVLVAPMALNAMLAKHPLDGRLVIMRAGIEVAEVDFRDFDTQKFAVFESSGATRQNNAELAVSTGRDAALFTLRMRKISGKWMPFLFPAESRLLDGTQVLGVSVMPNARFVFVEGKQLKFIYYY